MKIMYTCADRGIPLLGNKGASVHLRSLAAGMARRGNEVTVACQNLEGDNPLPLGVRIEGLPPAEELHENWLSGLCAELRPDVILERYSLSSGPSQAAARSRGIPAVIEVNAPLVDEAARYRGLENIDRWRLKEQELLTAADWVIAVSSGVKAHAVRIGVSPARVAVIHNGVDVPSFVDADGQVVRGRHGLGNATVVGFSGSLKPWHGVESLIQILDRLPSGVRLLIVGDGPQRTYLEKLANERGLGRRVVFTGSVRHAEMPEHLAAMDVGVAPYLPQDDFYFSPLKVIEYLAAGLPVVGSDQGDMGLLVGNAGILVPAGDLSALTAAITSLATDGDLRGRLAKAARAQARGQDWSKVAERVETVLASPKVAA